MPDHSRIASVGASMVLAVLSLTGCTAQPATSPSGDPFTAWRDEVNFILTSDDWNTSDESRDILERALEEGELTSDMYREAADNAAACLEDAGLTPAFVAPTKPYGQWLPNFQMYVPEGPDSPEFLAKQALADDCIAQHLDPVTSIYLDHPQVAVFQEGVFEQYRDAWYECLVERGAAIDHDATQSEYWSADIETADMMDPEGTCAMSTGFYDASVL
jgi:hypothetical protein